MFLGAERFCARGGTGTRGGTGGNRGRRGLTWAVGPCRNAPTSWTQKVNGPVKKGTQLSNLALQRIPGDAKLVDFAEQERQERRRRVGRRRGRR